MKSFSDKYFYLCRTVQAPNSWPHNSTSIVPCPFGRHRLSLKICDPTQHNMLISRRKKMSYPMQQSLPYHNWEAELQNKLPPCPILFPCKKKSGFFLGAPWSILPTCWVERVGGPTGHSLHQATDPLARPPDGTCRACGLDLAHSRRIWLRSGSMHLRLQRMQPPPQWRSLRIIQEGRGPLVKRNQVNREGGANL